MGDREREFWSLGKPPERGFFWRVFLELRLRREVERRRNQGGQQREEREL